jgi:hypothetical protein
MSFEPPNYWHRIIGDELATSIMSTNEVRKYLAKIGAKGGKASRRTLTPEQAKSMVAARVAKAEVAKARTGDVEFAKGVRPRLSLNKNAVTTQQKNELRSK